MTQEQREKAISTAVAYMACTPGSIFLPAPVREGIAALVEEVRELRAAVVSLRVDVRGRDCPPL